ncbi:MAG: hypothetical protein AAFX50_17135, partial [Acidobacteriota bacterium]
MSRGRIVLSAAGAASLLAFAAACGPGDGTVDRLPAEVEVAPRGHYELVPGSAPPRAIFAEGAAAGVCFRAPIALDPGAWRVDFGGERGASVAPAVDLPQPRGRTVCFEAPESRLDRDRRELCARVRSLEADGAPPRLRQVDGGSHRGAALAAEVDPPGSGV